MQNEEYFEAAHRAGDELVERIDTVSDPLAYDLSRNRHFAGVDADCPRWLEFVQRAIPDPGERWLLRAWFRYLLTPGQCKQRMLAIVGPGQSGKSEMCRVLRELIGQEKVASLPIDTLHQAHALHACVGRQVVIDEDASYIPSEAQTTLQSIIGGDPQLINPKHRDPFEAQLHARFVLTAPVMPNLRDGLQRRTDVVHTAHDPDLDISGPNMSFNLAGVLMWAVGDLDNPRVILPEDMSFESPDEYAADDTPEEAPQVEEWAVSPSIGDSHYPRYVPPGKPQCAFPWPKCLGPRFRGFVWHLEDGRKLIRQTCRPIMWSDGTDLVPGAEGVGWTDDTHPIDWDGMFHPVVADAVLMARESE